MFLIDRHYKTKSERSYLLEQYRIYWTSCRLFLVQGNVLAELYFYILKNIPLINVAISET